MVLNMTSSICFVIKAFALSGRLPSACQDPRALLRSALGYVRIALSGRP